jgi:hypothetical protein
MAYFINCSFIVLWLVGILLSIVRWKQSPQTAIATMIGLFFMIASSLMALTSYYIGITGPSNNGLSPELYGNLFRGLLFGEEILKFIGWALVIAAIFIATKRKPVSES